MTSKKRPFRNGDIVFIKYNGHSAITRLIEIDGVLSPDKDTALIYINEKSELSSALPEKFTEHIAECSNLCDATGQFKYYKNLCKVYQVVKRSLSLVNNELAIATGDKESLKGLNRELKAQEKRLRDANSELAAQKVQLERKLEDKNKSFWKKLLKL